MKDPLKPMSKEECTITMCYSRSEENKDKCLGWCLENKRLLDKRTELQKESWINNVLRIYPDNTRQEAEDLWCKLFNGQI